MSVAASPSNASAVRENLESTKLTARNLIGYRP
jgi:hypothetical protein